MKVISGSLKGRNIKGYDIVGTRPTMDRVKESIFGMIQNYLDESIVLDLFAGTGNYGIEAMSNGAKFVYFNDNNKKCIQVIENNLKEFNLIDKSMVINDDYMEALRLLEKKNVKLDLVFLDPPYKDKIVNKIMNYLLEKHLLNHNALIICEVLEKDEYFNEYLLLFKEKKYGDKKVLIYKYEDE